MKKRGGVGGGMTDLGRMPCGQGTRLMVEVGRGSGIDGWFGGRGEGLLLLLHPMKEGKSN